MLAAEKVPYIEEVVIHVREGYELVPLPEGSSYLGFIFARAPSAAQAEAALRAAHACLRVVVMPLWKGECEQEAGAPRSGDATVASRSRPPDRNQLPITSSVVYSGTGCPVALRWRPLRVARSTRQWTQPNKPLSLSNHEDSRGLWRDVSV